MYQRAFYRIQTLCITVWAMAAALSANPLEPPVATPPSGSHFVGAAQVALSHPTTGTATIRYTMDGTEPTETSPAYNASQPITIEDLSIIKAKAYPASSDTGREPSLAASFFYIPEPRPPQVSINDSTFFDSLVVTLNHPLKDVDILYSLDGSQPSQLYTEPLIVRQTSFLSAVAMRDSWAPSDTTTATYIRTALAVFNESDNLVTYLTERDFTFTLALQTDVPEIATLQVTAFTLTSADRDTLTLLPAGNIGEITLYQGSFPLDVSQTPVIGDGQVTPAIYDSIWFHWVSPQDPTKQYGTMVHVRPSPRQSTLAFVDRDLRGIPRLDGSEGAVYILVEDQEFDPNRTDYYVRFSNRLGSIEEGTSDFFNATLEELEPGRYLSTAPLEVGNFNTSDDVLQLMDYDQILAIYYDPVDGDNATGSIQFGTPVSIQAQNVSASTLFLKKHTGDYLKIRLPLVPNAPVALTNVKGFSHSLGNTRTSGSPTFDVSHLDPGVYVLRAGRERVKILLR